MYSIPKDHPLKDLKFRELHFSQFETLLYTEYGCSYRSIFEDYVRQQGASPDTIEMWSVEAIKQCVMCGLGITLLPLFTVQSELRDKKLNGILTDEIRISTQLAYHKNKWLSPAINKLLILVREHYKLV
jgi:DNA-binding transcriptional LysR family regulator